MVACAAGASAGESGMGRQRRVLLVEDDPSSRDAMVRLLRYAGLDVRSAGTLAEAFEALAWDPHCVILDLMLPDGNGAALLSHIRTHALKARVAVVTATADPLILNQVKQLRPELVLAKPIDLVDLSEWLRGC